MRPAPPLVLSVLAYLASVGVAQNQRYTGKALAVPFEFLNRTEFGTRTSIKALLKKDDVDGVVVAFVSSMGSFGETAPKMQKLYDEYRKRGVVIIVSVETSDGTKPLKATVKNNSMTVPVSPTSIQWTTFQKVAGNKSHNTWPWTFYVDKQGNFVHFEQSQPSKQKLDELARPAAPTEADEGGETADAGAAEVVGKPESQPAQMTLDEITIKRPESGGRLFTRGRDSLRLAKPLAKGGDPGVKLRGRHGAEAVSEFGKHEAFVHVATPSRQAHTNVGNSMVDPGSKSQLLAALQSAFETELHLTKVRKLPSSRLGRQTAGELRFKAAAVGLPEYGTSVFVIPMRKSTYIVTLARTLDSPAATKKELAAVRKLVVFKRAK